MLYCTVTPIKDCKPDRTEGVLTISSINQLQNLRTDSIVEIGITSQLLTEFPSDIFHFKVKRLDLSFNNIASIPCEIQNLDNLQALSLVDNNIQNLQECFELNDLLLLNLSGNKITVISPIISAKNICHLALSFNNITTLPNNIDNLQYLFYLNLNNNSISKIPEEICNLSNLRTLLLNSNNITELPECFYSMKNLVTVDLRNNPLNAKTVESLKKMNIEGVIY